jgi:hypothetical protein
MMTAVPEIIFPETIGSSIFIVSNSPQAYLNSIFPILSILSFAFSWIASSIMLKEYSNKVGGTIKYWVIVSIPLIFYLSQFFVQFNSQIIFQLTSNITSFSITSFSITSFSITLTIIFILSKLIGGLLFGIPFWVIAKTIHNSAIKTSMTIAGFGFIFLFVTNQANGIVVTPYPPFGITTSLFFGISSFLVMIGFYCSALYMSEHRDIRRIIKNDIRKYDLLTQMSNKFIEDETLNYINHFKKLSKSELFVNYPGLFLNDEDIKQYVRNVINEISKKDNNNTDNKKE